MAQSFRGLTNGDSETMACEHSMRLFRASKLDESFLEA